MSQAYQKLQLDDESKQYTTINKQKGLFQYTRLPYGISPARGIFQQNMKYLLQNIPYVISRVDDILVPEASGEDRLNNLEVLKRLASAGLRLWKNQCVIMEPQVTHVPWSQGQQGRNSTFRRQGRRHHQCISAEECVRAKVVPRHDQLLPEISPLNELLR